MPTGCNDISMLILNSPFWDKFREVESEPLLLENKIIELQEQVYKQCGHKFKQLLIQTEKQTGRIKIDFEFDDPERWAIKPAKLKELRENLRPDFS